MPSFSKQSRFYLETCDKRLQRLFNTVILYFDCTVIEGHRTPERQKELLEQNKTMTLHSKHLQRPSLAVDAAPCPVDWEDRERFIFFGGFVLAIAKTLRIPIRWGGDWSRDMQLKDNKFDDLVHFEIANTSSQE